MRSTVYLSLLLLFVGCVEHPNIGPKPNVPKPCDDDIVVITSTSATAIHKESARVRADIYSQIANKIESGDLHTVNDVVEFSSPLFGKAGETYFNEIDDLRKKRLGGAEEQLPKDAAAVFRQFAAEYANAAK